MHIRVRNVNDALPAVLGLIQGGEAASRDSRNGPVAMFAEPFMTTYLCPTERVLFNPARDANPFFHLFESLWMLDGRDDVAFVARFVNRMRTFSDDGVTLHGAYGRRWIGWFGDMRDQLAKIIRELRKNPDSRRCVIAMWDGHVDLDRATAGGKDVPCNTQAYVAINTNGELDLTIMSRSNDIIWGAYGANAVHFSYLQEFLAAGVGVPVGKMYQFTNNHHAYSGVLVPLLKAGVLDPANLEDPYRDGTVEPFPLMQTPLEQWREDLGMFREYGPVVGLRDPFFRRVATPMWVAHEAYRKGGEGRYDHAREALVNCRASDWALAADQWLDRREKSQKEKAK